MTQLDLSAGALQSRWDSHVEMLNTVLHVHACHHPYNRHMYARKRWNIEEPASIHAGRDQQ